MASSSGNRLPLLLLLLSLSSSLVAGVPVRQNFNKLARTTIPETTKTKQKPQQKQPEFYPAGENQYGLDLKTPPQTPATHVPPSTPKQNVPPPPSKKWLPKNYDPWFYISDSNEVSPYTTQIIEDDTKTVPTAETLNESDFDEEELDTTDFEEEKKPPPPTDTADPTHHSENSQEMRQGMSDTKYMANGMYHYDLNTESFTSPDHPTNKYNNEVQTNKNQYYDRYSSKTNKNQYYDRYSYNNDQP